MQLGKASCLWHPEDFILAFHIHACGPSKSRRHPRLRPSSFHAWPHVWWCFPLYANRSFHSNNLECPLKALCLFYFLMLTDIQTSDGFFLPLFQLCSFFLSLTVANQTSFLAIGKQCFLLPPPPSFKSWDKPAPKPEPLATTLRGSLRNSFLQSCVFLDRNSDNYHLLLPAPYPHSMNALSWAKLSQWFD